MKSPNVSAVAPGSNQLPHQRFMCLKKAVQVLLDASIEDSLSKIPDGEKSNCYFVLNKSSLHQDGRGISFYDDAGHSAPGTSHGHTYFLIRPSLTNVIKRGGMFYTRSRKGDICLNPQPKTCDIIVASEVVSQIKCQNSYSRKTLSFFDGMEGSKLNSLALVQYQGILITYFITFKRKI